MAEGRIQTQPGKFRLGGGLVVGCSGAEPVTDDYPGQRPWAFTGGTIKRVIIDVSGTPFADLAKEAAAAYARRPSMSWPMRSLTSPDPRTAERRPAQTAAGRHRQHALTCKAGPE